MDRQTGKRAKESSLDFTQRAGRRVREAVQDPYFRDADPDVIFDTLKEKVKVLSFGDYLKRYLYGKGGLSGDYQQVPPETYRRILCDSFRENDTPCSFTGTTAKLSALAKNWIGQKAVARNVVFLLGFGLKMTVEEVDEFLTKALLEQRINSKDPFETICWYCLKNGLGYREYERFWDRYEHLDKFVVDEALIDRTFRFMQKMTAIRDEQQLMNYLMALPQSPGTKRQSVAARMEFDRLYEQTREMIAEDQTEMERDRSGVLAGRMMDKLSRDDRLYDYQKLDRIERKKENYQQYRKDEIGAADIEQWLFASVPKDVHGNLLPMKQSALNEQFAGKRLNRQHIGEILAGKAPVTRYDLITLHFLVFSRQVDRFRSSADRYYAFIEETNRILEACDMRPLYVANPYESFILMCMLADDPLGSFADTLELSYEDGGGEDL